MTQLIPFIAGHLLYAVAHIRLFLRNHYMLILILMPLSGIAQPFVGIEVGNKGAGANLGFLSNKFEIKAGYNASFLRASTPALLYASAGYQIPLSEAVSLTPSVGIAQSKYVTDKAAFSLILPKYGMELGYDQHIGRVYISGNYAGYWFVNVGIRGYIK